MSGGRVDAAQIVQLAAFNVGDEEYVVDIMRVREILRPQALTPVRRGPRFVEGVLSLRGAIIPVIDLRRRFELPPRSAAGAAKIMVLMVEGRSVGIIVDRVTEVVRLPKQALRPAPSLLGPTQAPYFMGLCQHRGRTLILLNIKNVVATEGPIGAPDGALHGGQGMAS